jgi:hypothetical protein
MHGKKKISSHPFEPELDPRLEGMNQGPGLRFRIFHEPNLRSNSGFRKFCSEPVLIAWRPAEPEYFGCKKTWTKYTRYAFAALRQSRMKKQTVGWGYSRSSALTCSSPAPKRFDISRDLPPRTKRRGPEQNEGYICDLKTFMKMRI